MFTEIDYLVQKERHQDHIDAAERFRRGEGNLPARASRLSGLAGKLEQLVTAAGGWGRGVKTMNTTLGKTNA